MKVEERTFKKEITSHFLRNYDTDPIVAIHVNAKSGGGSSSGGGGGGPTNPPPVGGDCNKNESERVECGWFGIQQHQCEGESE